jgi:hypothetical protein
MSEHKGVGKPSPRDVARLMALLDELADRLDQPSESTGSRQRNAAMWLLAHGVRLEPEGEKDKEEPPTKQAGSQHDLTNLLAELAQARREAAGLARRCNRLWKAWHEEHRALVEALSAANSRVSFLEAAITRAALAIFWETGNPRPVPGVEVTSTVDLVYDHREAIRWCTSQPERHGMLHLDHRSFEATARNLGLPFVRQRPVVQVHIARPDDTAGREEENEDVHAEE